MILPPPLAPLTKYAQFVRYKLVPRADGKVSKLPIQHHTGEAASTTDPSHWCTYAEAVASPHGSGLGFVFTDNDPFYFVDIDACLEGTQWSAVAQDVMRICSGAAVEVSQSGTGLHIFGVGTPPEHSNKNTALGLEFYTRERFVALTGDNAVGDASHAGADLIALAAKYFPASQFNASDWTDGPVAEWKGHLNDDDLLKHALDTRSTAGKMGASVTFSDLWHADADRLGQFFPGDPYDASSADAALATHLAFWTGKDCERTLRLMMRSGLVRDKWERESYIHGTIQKAAGVCKSVHQRKEIAQPGELEGRTFLNGSDQLEYFKGCVYVRDAHRVFVPDGSLLKPEQFKVGYGGKTFVMDEDGSKVSRNAWEAFTESRVFRPAQVHRTMFRPDMQPGEIFEYEGVPMVNSYVPAPIQTTAGDVGPWLRHLEKILPDAEDRQIVLSYMAACVQHQGIKFQWTILVQGVEGNGKTLLSTSVAHAIGVRHVHSPRASEISAKFNSWIKDKTFVYVEDVYYPESRSEILEALKPIITNNWQPVEMKGVDQTLEYVVANMILNSNHKDAVRKTHNDRRFAVFYTAQQEYEHLARDGMDGDYFPNLYRWLKEGGTAAVSGYLKRYQIPDKYNPALVPRAPKTSSHDEAIEQSLGSVEQEVKEAIAEGKQGFCGGWVSSIMLDRLLDQRRRGHLVPVNRRRALMQSLGYDLHPNLHNGRVNNPLPLEGGKPRLYVKKGHLALELKKPSEIARAYTSAQAIDPSAESVAEKMGGG